MRTASQAACAALFVCLVTGSAAAQGASAGRVVLKNGGFVTGEIVAWDPEVGANVRLPDGSLRNIPADKIERVESGSASASEPVRNSAGATNAAVAPAPALSPAAEATAAQSAAPDAAREQANAALIADVETVSVPERTSRPERDDGPMGPFGFGVLLGYEHQSRGWVGFGDTNKKAIAGHDALRVTAPLNLGRGAGFGWDIEPFFVYGRGSFEAISDVSFPVWGVGVSTGPALRFRLADKAYLSASVGPSLAIYGAGEGSVDSRFGSSFKFDAFGTAVLLGGRAAATGTYYITSALGLVGQLGMSVSADFQDPAAGSTATAKGLVGGVDLSVGVRLH